MTDCKEAQSVEHLAALYGFVVIYRRCLRLDVVGGQLTAGQGVHRLSKGNSGA